EALACRRRQGFRRDGAERRGARVRRLARFAGDARRSRRHLQRRRCSLRGSSRGLPPGARGGFRLRSPRGAGFRARAATAGEVHLPREHAAAGDGSVAGGAVAAAALRLRRAGPVPRIREAGRPGRIRNGRPREPALFPARPTPRSPLARRARDRHLGGSRRRQPGPPQARHMTETPEKKIVEHYPPPQDEPPPPTFRQALVGYGSILVALIALGVLIGVLIKVLR